MSSSELLSPGESIRPKLTLKDAEELATNVYGFRCESICELDGYDDRNFKVTVKSNQRYRGNSDGDQYVLKILNSLDSKKVDFIEGQNELLLYLSNNNISCPIPMPTLTGSYYTIKQLKSGNHIVRAMKYLPGIVLLKVPEPPTSLFSQIGTFAANLDRVMEKFHHPAYKTHRTLWMLESVPELRKFSFAIKDNERRCIVERIIDEFEDRVLKNSDKLEKGMIHGDFNEQNILVERIGEEWRMTSILDFGDTQYSCYVFELAILMTYIMILARSLNAGGYVLRGYSRIRKISDEEWNLLKICIEARICQSLVMGAYSSIQDPENSYILTTSKPGWELLLKLRAVRKETLLNIWRTLMME